MTFQKSPAEIPHLVAIVGPTASGKSSLGVFLAEKLGGEVVACDSTQLYRGLDIGTAKPTEAERRGVRHHLLDVLGTGEAATAGGYRELAQRVLDDLKTRRKLPVFTVGTGLYLRALLEGLADLPQRSEEIRERLRISAATHRPGHLHGLLRRIDPGGAKRIAAADEQKLIRAIEVCLLTRAPLSQAHLAPRLPLAGWHAIKIGLMPPREELYRRIEQRTDAMLQAGWLDEVRGLLASGAPSVAKPFDFIGYRELRDVLQGKMTLETARAAIQQATRRYAKRQLTWFRREPGVRWFDGFGSEADLCAQVLGWLKFALQRNT